MDFAEWRRSRRAREIFALPLPPPTRSTAFLAIVGTAVSSFVVFWSWLYLTDIGIDLDEIKRRLVGWEQHAAIASVLGMIAHSFLPIPGELLAVANGFAFGFVYGTALTWVGAMLGAILSFMIARQARPVLVGRARERQRIAAALNAPVPAITLLLVRLLPVVSFNLINYVAGVANVKLTTFLWTTGLGIVPASVISAAIGSEILDASGMGAWLLISGVAFVAVAGLAARKALARTEFWRALKG